jgi:hypothetical protein
VPEPDYVHFSRILVNQLLFGVEVVVPSELRANCRRKGDNPGIIWLFHRVKQTPVFVDNQKESICGFSCVPALTTLYA